jgi:rhomboid family GlyGly-CTERM serine protease
MLVPAAGGAIEYNRELIADGELWRIVTCHFPHFTAGHFGWCLLATVVLGAICEVLDRRLFAIATVTSMILIPVALFEFEPAVNAYRGLSGVASTLFVVLLLDVLRRQLAQRDWLPLAAAAALGVLFVAKIVLEMSFGVTVFVANAGRTFDPVPVAHLCGVACALAAVGCSVVRCGARQ